jgi:molybdopterin-guanine dinucleotide biosynthesis protein A
MPDPATILSDATLAVLAGGRGTRMGRPKGLLDVCGRPVLDFLLDRLDWPGAKVLVTSPGREHPPGAERFDQELVDPIADQGPLRGVLTALDNLLTPFLIVTPVDMPGVRREQLEWLARTMWLNPGLRGIMLMRPPRPDTGPEPRIEPLPCILGADARGVVADLIASNRRSLKLLPGLRAVTVLAAPAWPDAVWTNVNRPEEWEAFVRTTCDEMGSEGVKG